MEDTLYLKLQAEPEVIIELEKYIKPIPEIITDFNIIESHSDNITFNDYSGNIVTLVIAISGALLPFFKILSTFHKDK